jgi:manganese-dependent inorganic pyrophosphatase
MKMIGPDTILVIGHKNPDVDSVVSSIAYAHLKLMMGIENVIAASAGEINRESQFVLDYFGFKPPLIVDDVYLRVEDIMNRSAPVIEIGSSFKEILEIIDKKKVMMVPVVEKGRLRGIIGVMEVAASLVAETNIETSRRVSTTAKNILHCLGGNLCIGDEKKAFLHGNIIIGAMSVDSIIKRIRSQYGFDNIVLVGDRKDAQLAILEEEVKCLIITGGFMPHQDIIKKAKEKGIVIISSPHDTITSVRLVKLSASVESLMEKEITALRSETFAKDAAIKISQTPTRSLPVINEDNVVVGVVTDADLSQGWGRKLILVDHNEEFQGIEGLREAEIIEVIDHHKIGNISSIEPIHFTCEPVGSTATLIAEKYEKNYVSLSPKIAGLLLAGIISDTLMFKASTTTEKDLKTAEKLSVISSVDIEKFAKEMFKYGVDMNRSAVEIILSDFKEYEIDKVKIGIGQIQVFDDSDIRNKIKEIVDALDDLLKAKNLELIMLLVTDMLWGGSTVIFSGNREILKLAFGHHFADGPSREFFLKGALSRKKDFLPNIARAIRRFKKL